MAGQTLTIPRDAWEQLPIAPAATTPSPTSNASAPGVFPQLLNILGDTAVGAGKGLVEHGVQGGALLRKIPGVDALSNKFPSFNVDTESHSTAQTTGKILEHLIEILSGGKVLGSALEGPVVNLGLKGSAGNPLIMNAKPIANAIGAGTTAAASDLMHHDGNNALLDAGLAAAGPLAGAGTTAFMQTPIGRQVVPYLGAVAAHSIAQPIVGDASGLGAGLAGFGLSRIMVKQALEHPGTMDIIRRLFGLTGAGAAATTSELNR